MHDRFRGHSSHAHGWALRLVHIILIATAFLGVAVINRLPVLFADTIAYSSAGEIVLGALQAEALGFGTSGASSTGAQTLVHVVSRGHYGVSEARSPYYGIIFATLDRVGGVWFVAAAQSIVVAIAITLLLPRLGLSGSLGVLTVCIAIACGLGFYAVVLLPDVFLGLVIVALALLICDHCISQREYHFWLILLFFGMIFHRSFTAVALLILAFSAFGWRRPWLARRGLVSAVLATLAALAAHAAVAPVAQSVYGAKMASPPFLLARMIEGTVVPEYLNRVCPKTAYVLCRLRHRFPMDHDQFLWSTGPDGVFNTMTLAERQSLIQEANSVVINAAAERPFSAVSEALRYSVREFLFAGMEDFSQQVPTRWRIAPSLSPALKAYQSSGIVRGDFPLHTLTRSTQLVYHISLCIFAFALLIVLCLGLQRSSEGARPMSKATISMLIIVGGIVCNAGVSGTLSGIRDRYTGRIAWLAPVVAVAMVAELFTFVGLRQREATGCA